MKLRNIQPADDAALAEIIRSLPPNPNDPSSYPAIEKALRETGAGADLTHTGGDRSGSP